MTDLDRGIISWTGTGVVGGGVSVFYATPGGSFMTKLHDFFSAIIGFFPATVTLTFPSSGDTIDSATGHLVGSWTGTTQTNLNGLDAASYSGRSGATIGWLTNTLVPPGGVYKTSHRVKGRTFLVPVKGSFYQNDGTIEGAVLTSLKTNADALITAGAGHFHIWHRPSPGGSDGVAAPVVSSRIKDKVAVLTSRSV